MILKIKVSLVAWFIFLPRVILFPKCSSLWYQGDQTPRYLCHFFSIQAWNNCLATNVELIYPFRHLDVFHVVSSLNVVKPSLPSWPWYTRSFWRSIFPEYSLFPFEPLDEDLEVMVLQINLFDKIIEDLSKRFLFSFYAWNLGTRFR